MSKILEKYAWHREHIRTGPDHELGNLVVELYDYAKALETICLKALEWHANFPHHGDMGFSFVTSSELYEELHALVGEKGEEVADAGTSNV